MIPGYEVTAAVLARLRAVHPHVYDLVAPAAAQAPYAVLEHPPGPGAAEGDLDDPESDAVYRYRIRSVGADTTAPATLDGAREQAERLAYRLHVGFLNRDVAITGDTWTVAGRMWVSTGGIDHAGPTVNIVDDFDLWVVPA